MKKITLLDGRPKRLLSSFLLLALLAGCATAKNDSEEYDRNAEPASSENENSPIDYEQAYERWLNSGITSYQMRIRYNAFSPEINLS